jgi:hypothetical protein
MKAFNSRIKPRTVGSVPFYSLILWVITCLLIVLSLSVPTVLQFLFSGLAVVCFVVGLFMFLIRDKLLFVRCYVANLTDSRRRSIDLRRTL